MPSPIISAVTDGDYDAELQIAPSGPSYPFGNDPTPDATTKLYERMMEVAIASWAPRIAVRTAGAPDVDVTDSSAYLVAESKPDFIDGEIARFTRTFARIPGDQVKPGSVLFPRPVLHAIKSGTAFAVSFDEQYFSHIFTSRLAISSVGALVAGTVPIDRAQQLDDPLTGSDSVLVTCTGGSYTVIGTTAASTIRSGLTTAGATGVTVGRTLYEIVIQWTGGINSFDGSSTGTVIEGNVASGITIKRGTPAKAALDTQKPNLDPSIRFLNVNSHSGVVGDRVPFWNNDKLVAISHVMVVVDANNFGVPSEDIDGKDLTLTHCAMSSDAALCVVNGPKTCDTRTTTRFYLPGVTGGIATDADIPKQTPQTDPISWLAAIIANTAWPVYQVADLTQWMGSILMQATTALQLSDAVDTVTP